MLELKELKCFNCRTVLKRLNGLLALWVASIVVWRSWKLQGVHIQRGIRIRSRGIRTRSRITNVLSCNVHS